MKRILLVINIASLLNDRWPSETHHDAKPRFDYESGNNYVVWNRPGMEAFVDWLFEKFDVAVWSSAFRSNHMPMLEPTFGERRLVFAWSQEECTVVRMGGDAQDLIQKPLARVHEYFPRRQHVLMVDTEADAVMPNPEHSFVSPEPWTFTQVDDRGLEANGELRSFLHEMWEEHQQLGEAFTVAGFLLRRPLLPVA